MPKVMWKLVCFMMSLMLITSALPWFSPQTFASSHMDAPGVTLDPSANTTDVYAFVQNINGRKMLVTALSVYPHEEPAIGPNKYNFDDGVLYQIHVATGNDLQAGRPTYSYQFQFRTSYKDTSTILQSYRGVVNNVGDASQNLTQTYTITRVDRKLGRTTVLGSGVVPPNNQGIATPFYNQNDDGNNPAKDGVATAADLDRYTSQGIKQLSSSGEMVFAGQRADGFYGDINAIFDLLQLRAPGIDSQGGFNLHMIGLAIPVNVLGGDNQIVGVYATTSRRATTVLRTDGTVSTSGDFVQVGRQGNPLFCEGLVGIRDKDRYNRTSPGTDLQLFRQYALTPELARLINLIIFQSTVAPENNRTDIAGIYIPDLIRCDLSTDPCRLAGGGPNHPTTPDDPGFSRLSIFGGDVLQSRIQDPFRNGGLIPGGWPNGRRFGDDVVDIGVSAIISDLRNPPNLIIRVAGDGVDANDEVYNKVFPYEPTPLNGRNRTHPSGNPAAGGGGGS